MSGRTVTDSAGLTCTYTPIEELKPGDVIVLGWRTTVERVEQDGDQFRIYWQGREFPDMWNPRGTEFPVEVS